jgi:hypothetical protein
MNFIEVCNTYFYQWGVLNTVLWKQTDGVKICFVLYLEKVKKQCCTESFLGGNKSCTQVNRTNLCWFFLGGGVWRLTPLSTIFQLFRVSQYYCWRKAEYPEKITDLPQVTDKRYHIMWSRIHFVWAGFELTMLVVIGTDCIGSYISNYHMIMTTTTPIIVLV